MTYDSITTMISAVAAALFFWFVLTVDARRQAIDEHGAGCRVVQINDRAADTAYYEVRRWGGATCVIADSEPLPLRPVLIPNKKKP